MAEMKKKRRWPWVLGICLGFGALAVWGISNAASSFSRAAMMSAYETAEATRSTIQSTVVGTGSLTYADAKAVPIPNDIEVTSVYCAPGDAVSKGDLLASVNREECETAMSSTFQQISETDAKLESTPSEPEVVTIKAPVAGRIVQVNAVKGTSVLEATTSAGSLMLISPAGRMGANIDLAPGAEVEPSQSVTLHLADGTQRTGTVRSVEEGSFSVELVDTNVNCGEAATATSLAGAELGSGTITALDGVSVLGPSGTVDTVSAALGESVDAGAALLTVRSSAPPAEYQKLQQERASLTRRYEVLSDMYQAGGLPAPVTGTVVSSNLKTADDASSASGPSGLPFSAEDASALYGSQMGAIAASGMSSHPFDDTPHTTMLGSATSSSQNMMLSASVEPDPEEPVEPPSAGPEQPTQQPEQPTPAPVQPSEEPSRPTNPPDQPTQAPSPSATAAQPRGIPALTVPLIPPIPTLGLQQNVNILPVYTGTAEWSPSSEQVQFETVYSAKITLHAMDGFCFNSDCDVSLIGTDDFSRAVSEDGTTLVIEATYPETPSAFTLEGIDWSGLQGLFGSLVPDLSQISSLLSSGSLGIDMSALQGLGGLDMSSLAGASALDMSALQSAAGLDMNALQGAALDLGSMQDTGYADSRTACTIASNDTMQLQIEINEMDILAVTPGMPCRVTIDAIGAGDFNGTVEEVSATAGTSGSYTVRITVEKTAEMRSGMSATAEITTGQSENVMSLPVDAVQEDGNRSFVYTTYEDGSFGGEIDVQTGVSNGSAVEILSGLEEGQEVLYPAEDPMERMMRLMTAGEEVQESARAQRREAAGQ